jgi:anti-sigma factor RsiW
VAEQDGDWEALNAYADGELDGPARNAMARRLAYDPALSARLAEVHAAKAAVSLLRPEIGTAPRRSRLSSGRRLAIAVSLLAAAGLGTFYHLAGPAGEWRHAPAELHAGFSDRAYVLSETPYLPVVSTPRIGDVTAIDLSGARLLLVDVATARRDGREIVAMHYRGRNGCRVTLVALEAVRGEEPPLPTGEIGLSAAWSDGAIHYTLMAGGMDAARFAAIRAYVRAETRRTAPGDELALAMRSATDGARPCA